jgi:hypothetical protein
VATGVLNSLTAAKSVLELQQWLSQQQQVGSSGLDHQQLQDQMLAAVFDLKFCREQPAAEVSGQPAARRKSKAAQPAAADDDGTATSAKTDIYHQQRRLCLMALVLALHSQRRSAAGPLSSRCPQRQRRRQHQQ